MHLKKTPKTKHFENGGDWQEFSQADAASGSQDLDVFAAVAKQTWNIVPVSFNQVGVDQVGVDPKMRSSSLSDFIPTAQPFASGVVKDK